MTTAERFPAYNPPIPDNLRIEYEKQLGKIIRWKGGILPSSREENDLEHTREMLIILENIEDNCTNIASEVDFTAVYPMAYIHDAGEIYAGDLALTHPNHHSLKPQVKRRERAGFRLLTKSLEDEYTRNLARELYRKLEQKAPTDKESQLVDFVDKVQAVRFGIDHVYPGNRMVNAQDRVAHLDLTANVLLKPAEGLFRALKYPHSKKEALGLIQKELERFTTKGYSIKEMQPHLNKVYLWSLEINHPQSIATKGEIR